MKVIIHIYNYMDDLRGGYISPVQQASHYKRYVPIFVNTFDNIASDLAINNNLESVIIQERYYIEFFQTIRKKLFSVKGILSYLKHTIKLIKLIKKNNVRILHVQNFESLILCFIAAKFCGCKVVLHIRGDAVFSKVKWLLKMPNYIITVSDSLKKSLLSYYSDNKVKEIEDKLFVIENGIEIPQYIEKSENEGINISIIGAVHDVKGQLEFVRDVWPLIDSKYKSHVNLFIIGAIKDESYFNTLEKLIKSKGYKNITFTGLQRDIGKWYQKTHIVVNYSLFEGLPRVVLEAMSYGTPVVGTRIVGNTDIIVDEHNGYLVDRDTPQQTSQTLISLIENDKHRNELGDNARRHIMEDRFNIQTSAERIENFYDSILNK
jgi:L-malate glycosyltransferase